MVWRIERGAKYRGAINRALLSFPALSLIVFSLKTDIYRSINHVALTVSSHMYSENGWRWAAM